MPDDILSTAMQMDRMEQAEARSQAQAQQNAVTNARLAEGEARLQAGAKEKAEDSDLHRQDTKRKLLLEQYRAIGTQLKNEQDNWRKVALAKAQNAAKNHGWTPYRAAEAEARLENAKQFLEQHKGLKSADQVMDAARKYKFAFSADPLMVQYVLNPTPENEQQIRAAIVAGKGDATAIDMLELPPELKHRVDSWAQVTPDMYIKHYTDNDPEISQGHRMAQVQGKLQSMVAGDISGEPVARSGGRELFAPKGSLAGEAVTDTGKHILVPTYAGNNQDVAGNEKRHLYDMMNQQPLTPETRTREMVIADLMRQAQEAVPAPVPPPMAPWDMPPPPKDPNEPWNADNGPQMKRMMEDFYTSHGPEQTMVFLRETARRHGYDPDELIAAGARAGFTVDDMKMRLPVVHAEATIP